MLPVYLASLALGGLIIVASIFLGDHDHDADADADLDIDADADLDIDAHADLDIDAHADGGPALGHGLDKAIDAGHDAGGTWLPFLSLRFWTFALASFGAAGTLFELLGFPTLVAAPSAFATGVAIGWAVAWAFHKLKAERVSGDIGLRGIRGREGRLLLPVGPDKLGKVRVVIDGQDVDLLARTRDEAPIDLHESVLIVEVSDGFAEVTALAAPGRRPPH